MFPSDYFGHAYFPPPYFPDLGGGPPPTPSTGGFAASDPRRWPVVFSTATLATQYDRRPFPVFNVASSWALKNIQKVWAVIYGDKKIK